MRRRDHAREKGGNGASRVSPGFLRKLETNILFMLNSISKSLQVFIVLSK